MGDFFAAIDKRRFWSNVVGYVVVALIYFRGPEMVGFLGQAVWAYIWFYPIYYIGMLVYRYNSQGGAEK